MKNWPAIRTCMSYAALTLACIFPVSGLAALHCDIDTGGAAPFSPYTRENPVAVDQGTPDYTVILALDYAQFLPNMRLTCSSDGADFSAPASFDGTVTLSLSSANDQALDWAGEASTANNGIKMKMYIKAVSYNEETLPDSYAPAALAAGKRLGVEYPILNGKDDTTLFQFGAQYNDGKTLYKFDAVHNYAIESMRVELIKFGWMEYNTQQVIPAGSHLTFTIDGMSGVATVDVPIGSGVFIAAPSCSLDHQHQTVGLGNLNNHTEGTFPIEGPLVRFGVNFTCSTYTNNVEITFDDANSALNASNTLVAHSTADGKALTGLGVGLYDNDGKAILTGVKQSLGVAQQGKNIAFFQAAIVQTAANITDSTSNNFTGQFSAKANMTITYY
ncbi:fimbrial protein [Rahnella woolbedingensis]|uniref:Type 1 fimbrial protein n=1 Tax=Rahnella woolbedingensis TaxID=1510574 RepID=A0A419N7S9_9GAMM|nr:fimbrial protein [Rahnella woolbedingensis]RJT43384.1 type 1 fimbrial protein [Rahnella woolbedingensis]